MVEKRHVKKDKILLWVPSLDAEKTIISVFDRIRKLKFEYHVLLVDNHSSDNTVRVARDYIKKNKFNCTIVENIKNIYYGGSNKVAWLYGINNGFDYMIILHSDGQYPIEYSDKLLKVMKEKKCHMVIGSRIVHKDIKKNMPTWRILGNKFLSAFNRWAYDLNLSEFFSEFKIYDLKFIEKIDIHKVSNNINHHFTLSVQLIKHKAKIEEIPIPCSYHKDAHHPSIPFTIGYVISDIYRGLRYKIFKI